MRSIPLMLSCSLCFACSVTLSGCQGGISASNSADEAIEGRYSGIGTYDADPLWRHLKATPANKEADSAALSDDSQIIVVVDRQTGEVRQCGNHSGYCVAMNPWTKTAPSLPDKLDVHADDLEAAQNEAAPAEEAPADAVRRQKAP